MDLKLNLVPDKLRAFKSFIDERGDLPKKDLLKQFNSHFHRYESVRTFNCLFKNTKDFHIVVQKFVEENDCFVTGFSSDESYQLYKNWCKTNDEKAVSNSDFNQAMSSLCIRKRVYTNPGTQTREWRWILKPI